MARPRASTDGILYLSANTTGGWNMCPSQSTVVVMSVEQVEFLLTVRRVVGGVDVEDQFCGRFAPRHSMAGEPLPERPPQSPDHGPGHGGLQPREPVVHHVRDIAGVGPSVAEADGQAEPLFDLPDEQH